MMYPAIFFIFQNLEFLIFFSMKLYLSFISIIPIYLYHDFWLLKPNIFAKFPQYPVLRCKLQTINSSFSLQKVSLYCFGVKFLWLKVCGLRMFFFKTVIFSVLVYHQIIQNIRSYSGEAGLLCTHWTWFFFLYPYEQLIFLLVSIVWSYFLIFVKKSGCSKFLTVMTTDFCQVSQNPILRCKMWRMHSFCTQNLSLYWFGVSFLWWKDVFS